MKIQDIQNIAQTPYAFIRDLLKGKEANHLSRNTGIIANDDGSVSVWLYATEIVRAYSDGRTVIRTNGHRTVTTRARINAFLPRKVRIVQSDWKWFVIQTADPRIPIPFTEGLTLTFDDIGRLVDWHERLSPYAARRIHEIATRFVFGTADVPTLENVARFIDGTDDDAIGTYALSHVVRRATDMREAIGTPSVA